MILSDVDLKEAIDRKDLRISPGLKPGGIQPASIDLTLGDEFAVWKDLRYGTFPVRGMPSMEKLKAQSFVLQPNQFALAHTRERIGLGPALMARVEGRSSLGRLGLMVHATAGYIDPGFDGHITLELFNLSPFAMILEAGQDICQMAVGLLSSPAEKPYGSTGLGSKYQGQTGVRPSRFGSNGS